MGSRKSCRHLTSEPAMYEICPKCGGTAVLLQSRDEVEEVDDLVRPGARIRQPIKIEEYRCQEQNCEHEFERIVREPQ